MIISRVRFQYAINEKQDNVSKLTYVGKIMAKSTAHNMCRPALLNGKDVCKGKDLLTKCVKIGAGSSIYKMLQGCLETNSKKAKTT